MAARGGLVPFCAVYGAFYWLEAFSLSLERDPFFYPAPPPALALLPLFFNYGFSLWTRYAFTALFCYVGLRNILDGNI